MIIERKFVKSVGLKITYVRWFLGYVLNVMRRKMNKKKKKTRDEMRELAEKAKEVYLSHEVHEGGLLIWESNDWSYILNMGDFNDDGEMGKHIASCSPDRILELLDYVRELEAVVECGDELASTSKEIKLSLNYNSAQQAIDKKDMAVEKYTEAKARCEARARLEKEKK